MRILLAPMEGLLDHSLRDTLTRVGGIDLCVSKFIRVTDAVLPVTMLPNSSWTVRVGALAKAPRDFTVLGTFDQASFFAAAAVILKLEVEASVRPLEVNLTV